MAIGLGSIRNLSFFVSFLNVVVSENCMIVKYIDRAMSKAVYDKLDDGSFSGKIPECSVVIAFGETASS
jgi:hypothetical protein